jgi:hypothetical protein
MHRWLYPNLFSILPSLFNILSSSSPTKLNGPTATTTAAAVESDEFYIKAGFKGRSYHDEIVKAGRKPRKRGLKPWRGRGKFDKDNPMITCNHQRDGMTYFDVSSVYKPLIDLICKNVGYGSTVFTDEYSAYNQLQKHGFIRKSVDEWLFGIPSNMIATCNGIGYGSVFRIIESFKSKIPDLDLLRAVAVMIKQEDLSLNDVASGIRDLQR